MKTATIRTYLGRNKKETVLAPLFKMLEACFELFIPLLVADIIDNGIETGDNGYIIRRGILMIFFGVFGFLLAVIAQYFSARCAVSVSSRLRRDLFYHITDLNYKALDEAGVSTLITGMTSDINQVQNGVNMTLRLLLRSPFIVIGAGIMASLIDPAAALIFWCVIGALALIILLIMKLSTPRNAAVQRQLEDVTRTFRENLQGVRVVRAFNRQKTETAALTQSHDVLYRRQMTVGRISALLNPLTFSVVNLGIILLLWSGALRVDAGLLSQGQIIALINYMSQILVELIKFANFVLILSKAMACFRRIRTLLAIELSLPSGSRKADPSQPAEIVLEDVCFSYGSGGENAIDHVSCRIPAGSRVGIIGATGSGKTTLVQLIARYYERNSGSITLNGWPLEEYETESLIRCVSVAPQKAVLFSGTLRENLKWGNPAATEEQCQTALSDAGALDFVLEKGQGLDLPVEQNGRNFSGGQRQRLAIARALLKPSGLLILDDSYSALDFRTESHIRQSVTQHRPGCTVLTVSQRVSSIYNADQILVLDNGTLAGCGTHRDLYQTCPVYREICQSQHFTTGTEE